MMRSSFVTFAKDLYYELPTQQRHGAGGEQNSAGSAAFVNAFRAVIDGNSDCLILNHPHYFRYSADYMTELLWRCHLFNDEMALFLLSENYQRFYIQPAAVTPAGRRLH